MREQSRTPGFGAHHNNQRPLWPELPCGYPIHRPEPADMFGPEVVTLDCESIIRGFLASLLPPTQEEGEHERRRLAATNAVRTWMMFDHYTHLHQNLPVHPNAKHLIMRHIRAAAVLQASLKIGQETPELRNHLVTQHINAARNALRASYPGIDRHGFIVFLD